MIKAKRSKKILAQVFALVMAISCFTSALSASIPVEEVEKKNRKSSYSYVYFVPINHTTVVPTFSKTAYCKKEFVRTEQHKLLIKPSLNKVLLQI